MNQTLRSIKYLENSVKDPTAGLSQSIFYFIGRMTPYINVDLLIQSPIYGTLLTWRDDPYSGTGWHIPGGIIRFKEKIKDRIFKVGKGELGIKIRKFKGPIELNEIITNKIERSHFISLLYKCELEDMELKKILNICKKSKKIMFFKKVPKNFLKLHLIYEKYFKFY